MQLVSGRGSNKADVLLLGAMNTAAFNAYVATPAGAALLETMLATPWGCAYLATTPGNVSILARATGVGAYLNNIRQADGYASNATLAGLATFSAVVSNTTAWAAAVESNAVAMAIVSSTAALASVYANASATSALFANTNVGTLIWSNFASANQVANNAAAMQAVAGSTANANVLVNSPNFAVAISAPTALNALLRSSAGRTALVSPAYQGALFQSLKDRVLITLADTSKFTKVLSAQMQDAPSAFGGDPGAWGTATPGPLIVNVLRAGSYSGGGGYASWAALQGGGVLGTAGPAAYANNPITSNTMCVGGINYTESSDAGIVVDAWRALP